MKIFELIKSMFKNKEVVDKDITHISEIRNNIFYEAIKDNANIDKGEWFLSINDINFTKIIYNKAVLINNSLILRFNQVGTYELELSHKLIFNNFKLKYIVDGNDKIYNKCEVYYQFVDLGKTFIEIKLND